MSSNMFRPGQVFTPREWGSLREFPPEGSILRVTTEKATTKRDSTNFTVGCKVFSLGGMLARPDRRMSAVSGDDGSITISANFETNGRGGIKTSSTTLTCGDLAEYASEIKVITVKEVQDRIPTGIYACDTVGHNEIWVVGANRITGAADWKRITASTPGSTAGHEDSAPSRSCKPRLRSSFHGLNGHSRDEAVSIPKTVTSTLTNLDSMRDARSKGNDYHRLVTGK